MDITALRIFQAVAIENSISGAAKRLHYVQSNVTMRIKQLESEIGQPLFHRHNRGITLTSKGGVLFEYAERILRLFEEAQKVMQESTVPIGELKIGVVEPSAATRLPPVLTSYHAKYPAVDLTLKTGMPQEMVDAVLQYKMDGAFVPGPLKHSDLIQEYLGEEELVLVSGFDTKTLEQVKNQPLLVLPSGCQFRARLESLLREKGFSPSKIMEFGALDTILGCVSSGMGVSLVPKSVLEKRGDLTLFNFHTIPKKYSKISILFIYHRNTFMTSALQKFIDTALKYF